MTGPDAPSVEMLWETHEPHSALRERFGFAAPAEAARWVAELLDTHWGLAGVCERVVMSDRNALAWVTTASGRIVAKWSVAPERFGTLAEIARLTAWLDGLGLPVSAPVAALDGSLQVAVDGAASVGVQREVRGRLLDTTVPTQVRAAGQALARLHGALATYPDATVVVPHPGPERPLAERIVAWLGSPRAEHLPAADRRAVRRLVATAPADPLPIQLVHGDVRSANVLCVADEVVAVLDFEEARWDHRVVELARSAVLLGTRYREWGPVPPAVHAAFLAGYCSVHALTADEERWWDLLVLWQAFAMVPSGPDPTGWLSSAESHLRRLVGG
ncbi:phosphotransferase [Actinotalea sp. M2MS4P-6]|uniref:phosphotransferase n=1 Tax=Actinotalea sp. M2MS4P-6 TaxID=2983762 RepID=UPI0021E3B957|nr:phosphotransferase [Actinotalea sp. M2MS4P-6]MCV2393605.1 phosphotransferase [Actinotalea sp. M2MS4P-6]